MGILNAILVFILAGLSNLVLAEDVFNSKNLIAERTNLIKQGFVLSDLEKIKLVNDFFNQNLKYDSDQNVWGKNDYWAKPLETLTIASGDCDDYAIVKYDTLKLLNIPVGKMLLMTGLANRTSGSPEGHMVLAVYVDELNEYVILDNMVNELQKPSERKDLHLTYAFNDIFAFSRGF